MLTWLDKRRKLVKDNVKNNRLIFLYLKTGFYIHLGIDNKKFCDTNFVIHTYDNIIKEDDLGRFCAVCMKKLRNGSVPKYNIIWRCGFITNKKKQCSKTINSKHDKYCKQHFNLLYNVLCDKTKLPDTILDIFFEYL